MPRNLGDAFVRVRPDNSTFDSELKGGTSSGLKKLGGLIAGVFAGRAVMQGANALVGRASDLNETVNKSNVIFGRQAGMMRRWAKDSDVNLGIAKQAALGYASSFGDMFSQIGFAQKRTASMSKDTIRLAADLGSFSNLETSDVLDRIAASLRGEYDSLQAVIPNINAARVQQVALAQTGKKVASELTAQEKAAATLAIIHKDGARATGDFKRTQDGLANSNRIVAAQTENLKTKVGRALLPAWSAASKALRTEVMPPLLELADKYLPKARRALAGVVKGIDWGEVRTGIGSAFDKLKGIDWGSIKSGAAGLGDGLKGIDWGELGQGAKDLWSALKDLGPALSETGSDTANNTLSVFSVVTKVAADNVGLLEKALPLLIAAFVAYKGVQLANNAVGRDSVLGFFLQIGTTISLTAANRALAKSQQQVVASTVAQTGAENAGVLARLRATAATVASTVASKAAQVATKLWAATQWVLNAAMSANPIGLVIAAVALLVAGVIIAYKKVDWFRAAVDTVWGVLKKVGSFIAGAFLGYLKLLAKGWLTMGQFGLKAFGWLLRAAFATFDGILAAAEKGLGWVPKLGPKISAAREAFDRFGDGTIRKLDALGKKLDEARRKVDDLGRDRTANISVNVNYNYRNRNDPAAAGVGPRRPAASPRRPSGGSSRGRAAGVSGRGSAGLAAGGGLTLRVLNWREGLVYISGLIEDVVDGEVEFAGTTGRMT